MGSIKEMYEEFSDDQILEQLDDFGDGQFFMHEVAKRLRAKSSRIAVLSADRDAVLTEVSTAIWAEIEKLPEDDPEYTEGLQFASNIISSLRTAAPQPRMFPMTDGPDIDIPWSLAEEIYSSDAFDYFEQSRSSESDDLGRMAEGGGWSWRALADCFETYSAQCDYEAESDAPEAVTEEDVFGTKDFEIEMLRGQLREYRAHRDRVNVGLRADLATVTSNHKQVLTALAVARDMMNESAEELDTERAGHSLEMEDLGNLLAGAKHALAAEREAHKETKRDADGLADALKNVLSVALSGDEARLLMVATGGSAMVDPDNENSQSLYRCSDDIDAYSIGAHDALRAHDARRASEGEKGAG